MKLIQTREQLTITDDQPEADFVGYWFIALGAFNLIAPFLLTGLGANKTFFIAGGVVAIAIGVGMVLSRTSQETVIRRQGRIMITKTGHRSGADKVQTYESADITGVEYAKQLNEGAFNIAGFSQRYHTIIVYLNMQDGSRIKLGSHQSKKALAPSDDTFGLFHIEAQQIAAFLNVPLDDDPDKSRPLDG